jgi:predicted AlkP superfamily phosphohydrolase/phosphomutase
MDVAYIDPGTGMVVAGFFGWLIAFGIGLAGLFAVFYKRIFKFFRNNKKFLLIILAVVVALGAIFYIGKRIIQDGNSFDKRIIILGFDGLSPDIIEALMASGELPNFSQLKESGTYRRLSTTNPSQSPVAWSGFATGQNPGKHGVYDFIVRDPKTYGLALSLSKINNGRPERVIRGKTFWEYTSEENIPTVIISCPVTFPPDKVHGRMLSGMGVPDILGTEGTFTYYTSEMLDNEGDIGGNTFHIEKSNIMNVYLIGPRVMKGGRAQNVQVPVLVSLNRDDTRVTISYQGNKTELQTGEWSAWQEVVFKLQPFKKAHGIFKFYLVETKPDFGLYISPINFHPEHPFFQISHPKDYTKELTDTIGYFYTQGMPMDTWAVNEGRLPEEAFLEQMTEVLQEKRSMLEFEYSRFDNGVFFVYFESSDIVQHMFWRYIDEEHPLYKEDAPSMYKTIIESWYRRMDDTLGSVMSKMRDEDVLIVMSDHGFNTFRRTVHINSWLRQHGYLKLVDPDAESGAELLDDIDWENTKAYSIGFGGIFINQIGREAKGTVKPGRDTELLKEELVQKLKEWVDEKHDMSVVNRVYTREEIFWGPYVDETPDLYIGFNIGYRASWQTAIGGVPAVFIEDNLKKWSGSHLFDPELLPGILFCSEKIEKESPSIYDIAPTVLRIAGFDNEKLKECDFDGSPLLQ